MITDELKYGNRVRHIASGGCYWVVSGDAQVKIDEIVAWTPCVVYMQDGTQAVFVRNSGAFREKFEKISGFGPR